MAFGASRLEVFDSCPNDLECYVTAQKMRDEHEDIMQWRLGQYIEIAVATAVEHNLGGKKAKSKYLEKPMSQMAKENEPKKLTDAEKKKQVDLLFASLKVMQHNFEVEKKRKEVK